LVWRYLRHYWKITLVLVFRSSSLKESVNSQATKICLIFSAPLQISVSKYFKSSLYNSSWSIDCNNLTLSLLSFSIFSFWSFSSFSFSACSSTTTTSSSSFLGLFSSFSLFNCCSFYFFFIFLFLFLLVFVLTTGYSSFFSSFLGATRTIFFPCFTTLEVKLVAGFLWITFSFLCSSFCWISCYYFSISFF